MMSPDKLVRSADGRIPSLPTSAASALANSQPPDDVAAGVSDVALQLAFGYPKALALSAPLPRGGVWPPREPPPVVSDEWGVAMALAAAHLTEGEQVLAIVRTGLGRISDSSPGQLTVDLLPAALESERAERAHWQEFLARLSEARKETWKQLEEAEQGISRRMGRYVQLSERGELHLRLPSSVRRHVFAKALHSLDAKLGTDSFPRDASFGGVKFQEYGNCLLLLAAEALIRLSAADAVARSNPALRATRGRTTGWRVAGLAQLLASAPGARLEACFQAVRDLTLGPDEAEAYGNLPRAPLPPLIRTAPDHVLMSVAGCLDEPFQFLLWRLRHQYTADWDRAVDEREQTFRNELYESLTSTMPDRFVTLPRGVKVREKGRVVTDIDAVIFDKATGELGLFQLKWQDPFGASLTRRASSAKNFVPVAERWVAAVSDWVASRGTEDVAAALGIPRRQRRAVQPRLFVLGRLAAHFSEFQAPDRRAAWGTWPQVMNLVARTHDSADSRRDAGHSPLAWLESRLRAESPLKRQEVAAARTEQLLIGGLRLTVRRPASESAAAES